MLDDSDFYQVLLRYKNRAVTIQTYGREQIIGMLVGVHASYLRLANTQHIPDSDEGRWSNAIFRSEWEDSPSGSVETTIPMHHILSVTCDDENLRMADQSEVDPLAADSLRAIAEHRPLRLSSNVDELLRKQLASGENQNNAAEDDSPWADLFEGDRLPLICSPERLEIRFGARLVPLLADRTAKPLNMRIHILRREMFGKIGFHFPPVKMRSDVLLGTDEFVISINGVEVARSELRADQLLAILPDNLVVRGLDGEETREPAFGVPACWIRPEKKDHAEASGCTVVDANTVVITVLAEVIREFSHELLTYQIVAAMLQALRTMSQALVDDNFPHRVTTQQLHRIMSQLLRDGVSINCFERLVEVVAWHAESGPSFNNRYEQILLHLFRDEKGRPISPAKVQRTNETKSQPAKDNSNTRPTSPKDDGA